MTYAHLSVRDFLVRVQRGDIDLTDFYSTFFAQLKGIQKEYSPLVTVSDTHAFDQLPTLRHGPLHGLPLSVKDNICTKGIQSTAGSKILEGYTPPFDASAIERVKHAGGVIIGKTQMDEFGFGTFSVNSGYGIPKNPINPLHTAGGSSGGAAALTRAIDLPHVAIAESTGGSISAPASFCGVVGLTPTYGLVSRYGLIDYANSLDKIGVIARTVDDTALVLEQMAGFDTKDFTSLNTKTQDFSGDDVDGMKVGIPKEYMDVDPAIKKHVEHAADYLKKNGAIISTVSLPNTPYALAAYYIIATSEASTNLARYCGMRYGASIPAEGDMNEHFSKVRSLYFGQEAKRRIMLGTFARLAGYRGQYYLKAFQVRRLVMNDFERAFKQVDVLLAPTMPLTAPTFAEIGQLTPLQHYQMDVLTVGPNLAGIPHLSVPWGEHKGMPVGVHLLADHLKERNVLRAGRVLERGQTPLRGI